MEDGSENATYKPDDVDLVIRQPGRSPFDGTQTALAQQLRRLMRTHAVLTLFTAALLAVAASAQADRTCRIEPFQGATLPQGAVAQMTVTNAGTYCSITNYGVPTERQNPAYSGSITSAPTHGTASFSAPQAMYTPEPGFTGDDDFAYAAMAKGSIGQQLSLRVRVKVKVLAP